MPVYHFACSANLGLDELRDLVSREARRDNGLLVRLAGQRVVPVGSLNANAPASLERRETLDALNAGDIAALRHRERNRLFEAITHFAPTGPATELLSFLAELVASEFAALSSNALTICRKAVARLDEAMNLPSIRPRRPLPRRRFPSSD